MSLRFVGLAAFALCLLPDSASAQAQSRPDPLGTWRGTSLCQVHPSACHDETVVYRITRVNTNDSLALDARKIVGGKEEEMGVIGCRFNATNAQLTCSMPKGTWHFTVSSDSLVGELRLPDNTKYRDVRTARAARES